MAQKKEIHIQKKRDTRVGACLIISEEKGGERCFLEVRGGGIRLRD